MERCTNAEFADVHLAYGAADCNSRAAQQLYAQRYLRSHAFFACLHQKLSTNGSFTLNTSVRYTGIYGNERADWLAKEATKLSDLIPMSIPKSYHKKVFEEKIISKWNNLYKISNNAHLTKEFIPSIQSRLKAKHFHPNFKLTQVLTGHGNFKAYLKRFNLSPTDQCSCSIDGTKMPSICIVWPPPYSAFVEGKSSFLHRFVHTLIAFPPVLFRF
ncbi:RNase H domain-containing protein [Trichonephila clavipes]|nr:RNase H domain-containing protein [Trichonephila clavipes]